MILRLVQAIGANVSLGAGAPLAIDTLAREVVGLNLVEGESQDDKVTCIGTEKCYEYYDILKHTSRHPMLRIASFIFDIRFIQSSLTLIRFTDTIILRYFFPFFGSHADALDHTDAFFEGVYFSVRLRGLD